MMALFGVLRYNQWFSKAAVISPSIVPAMDSFRREVREPLEPEERCVLLDGLVSFVAYSSL